MAKISIDNGLEQAEAQMQVGQWRSAKKSYLRLLKLSDDQHIQVEVLLGLAKITQAEGKIRDNQRFLDKLVNSHPNYLPGLLQAIRMALQQQDQKRAEKIMEQTLERFPRQVDALKLAARVYTTTDVVRSKQILENVLNWYPEQQESLLDLAQILLRLGELQAAVNCFEKIEKIAPELMSDPRFIDLNQANQIPFESEATDIFERLIIEQESH